MPRPIHHFVPFLPGCPPVRMCECLPPSFLLVDTEGRPKFVWLDGLWYGLSPVVAAPEPLTAQGIEWLRLSSEAVNNPAPT
jgi:hypothetical protein